MVEDGQGGRRDGGVEGQVMVMDEQQWRREGVGEEVEGREEKAGRPR